MACADPSNEELRRAELRREIDESFDEKYVNFLGVPPSSTRLNSQALSCGWLFIHNQEDLVKALDCEDMPKYAEGIRIDQIPEAAVGVTGVLGRVTRADPAILEVVRGTSAVDERGMAPDRAYKRDLRDHHSCDEYGVGLSSRSSGLIYTRSEDGEYIPHDEVQPGQIATHLENCAIYFVVYKLRRRSPAIKSAKSAASVSAAVRETETEPAGAPANGSVGGTT